MGRGTLQGGVLEWSGGGDCVGGSRVGIEGLGRVMWGDSWTGGTMLGAGAEHGQLSKLFLASLPTPAK